MAREVGPATVLTEDFEAGLHRWIVEFEEPATSAVSVVDGQLDVSPPGPAVAQGASDEAGPE